MLNINTFVKYNVFIGHSKYNSILLSSWFFFKLRKNVWIINLFKTILFLKLVFKFLKYLVSNNFPFWFINMDIEKAFLFKRYAALCGEFSSTRIWVRGFLSNFKSIQKSMGNLYVKKDSIKAGEKKTLILNWRMTRYTWPRGLFLSNVPKNYIVCKEASNIQLPVVALVDTNIKSFLFSYPIPSNDDSIESVSYIMGLIATQLLLLKYKKIIVWYYTYKLKKKNLINYLHRVKTKFNNFNFLNNVHLNKWIVSQSFTKIIKFNKNLKRLTALPFSKNLVAGAPSLEADKAFNKLTKYTLSIYNRIKNNNFFFKTFLRTYKYKMAGNVKAAFLNTKKLNYLKLKLKKKKKSIAKQIFYFNYFVMLTLIRRLRPFHESFFFKQTNLKKRVKLSLLDFSNAVFVLNATRYILDDYKHLYLKKFKKKKHIPLVWLIPFITKFAFKDRHKWHHALYFSKEGDAFSTQFNCLLPKLLSKIKTPQTTLHFYNNWFLFLLKKYKKKI